MKQSINYNFGKGVDTKTDPWQVPIGNFLSLTNMVFTIGNRLTKRNGYQALPTLPEPITFLTTFNGNLTGIGSDLYALSEGTSQWYDKGTLQPIELSTLPLIRSNTNQSQLDTAVSSNGLVCTVYTDQTPTNLSTSRYLYAIADSTTGQNIIEPTLIPPSTGTVVGSPRVFILGSYFIIVFTNDVSGSYDLQYISVSINNPTVVTAPQNITTNYTPNPRLSWDGAVVDQRLFIAYNTLQGGQSIQVRYLTSTLSLSGATIFTNAGLVTATILSMTIDNSNTSVPTIWITYYNSGTMNGYALAVNYNIQPVLSPTLIISSTIVNNLAPIASNGVMTCYYEVANTYSYDATISTNYISMVTCTQSGTVGTPSILVRSVGLASKAFIVNDEYYFLAVQASVYQNTYFLLNAAGEVIARLAYSNGGGYCALGLPSVTLNGNVAQIGYLFKDFITSANTSQSVSITKSGIYSQTGLNLASFTIGTSNVVPAEIAQTLNLSGGFLWEYDGYVPIEQNFFLWCENMEGTPANTGGSMAPQQYQYQAVYTWTNNQGNIERAAPSIPIIIDMSTNNPAFIQPTPITFTAAFTEGTNTMTVSSTTGLAIGQIITDTTTPGNILLNTYITNISGLTITVNQVFGGTSTSDTIQTIDTCSVTLNIPTLRLTYKTANPVKIEIFRWSTAQEEFYQVTSIENPLINNVNIDYVTFVDIQADNQIQGNSLIYTTGAVIENIGAPSFNALTLFDDRLWGLDAEDTNLLWYSKQVIENTPVEMSDLFTFYIAPSIGSQGSTGPITALSPLDDKLIIFKATAMYYINGTGPDNTGTNSTYSQPFFITSVVGSSNQQSIAFIPDGLMFQSEIGITEENNTIVNGIWLLSRGLQVMYIGAPVEEYTRTALVLSAVSVPGTTQIRFTLDSGITLMYDYFYQQWGIHSTNAISATRYQQLHTFVNSAGQVFQETPGEYLDGSNPVTMSFTTAWINIGGLQGYQRAFFFYLLGQYITPHFLQVSLSYNYSPAIIQSITISPNNYSVPYGGNGNDEASPYGQETPYGGPGDIEQWRIFLANQRCQSIQLTIQEIYDSSLGVPAGEGIRISGLNFLVAMKRGFRAQPTSETVGGGSNGRAS